MKKVFRAVALLIFVHNVWAQAPSVAGDWQGALDAGGATLHLVLHLKAAPDGALSGSLDSVDQGANGIPISRATLKANHLSLAIDSLHGGYEATLSVDQKQLDGTFTQGVALPLKFTRVSDVSMLSKPPARPQNPVKPYPYREEEVSFASRAAGVTLAGTLTVPQGKGPFPAVVLIAGSGPQTRDEPVAGHSIFLVLADQLTRRGIAVLRYDKRGLGKSTGAYDTATAADFADDAEGALTYLKTRPEANAARLGLVGHSEGGEVAPMVAARNPDAAFLVLLAGPAVSGLQVLVEQNRQLALVSGADAATADHFAMQKKDLFDLAASGAGTDKLAQKLREQLGPSATDALIQQAQQQLTSPWFLYFLKYDPAVALRQIHCPVLALNGDKDVQVSAAQNQLAMRKALEHAGNSRVRIELVAGANHLFQQAKTGSPAEYGQIEQTIDPAVIETVSTWIHNQDAAGVAPGKYR